MPPAKVDKSIKNYLLDFGLTEKEIKLYLTLLKTGPNTIMNLARETGIKRSTTHNNVEELIKKGLVSQTNYGERRMVVAEDPEKLNFLMDQKKWDIKKLEESLGDVIGKITETVPEAAESTKVDVKYYEGKKNVFKVYQESLGATEVRSFVNLDKYFETFPNTGDLWYEALEKNKERELFTITQDTALAREVQVDAHSRYHSRFLSGETPFGGVDFHIYDNKIAIIKLDKLNPFAIMIESSIIVGGMVAIHSTLWNMAKE